MVQITASPSQLLIANPIGRAIFIFGAKIGLKSTKNVEFCIISRPMWGDRKFLRSKNFKQKLRLQVVEAEALKVEAIQKLPLLHPWL